jgi:ribosomal protein S18 acetylase RimI-like enzyme
MRTPIIRAAALTDLDSLLALEADSFGSDRLSARSFRHFLKAPTAACRVGEAGGHVVAYALTMFRKGSRVARIYSIAVAEEARGRGLAAALLADAERIGVARGAERISLEVRGDNPAAIRLYERHGYAFKGIYPDYYEDGADARRYEKRLDRTSQPRSGQAEP